MEFQKIVNFLDTTSDDKELPRFVTEKWVEVYDQSGGNYDINKQIRKHLSKELKHQCKSDLGNFNDAYIVVKGDITLGVPNYAKKIEQ